MVGVSTDTHETQCAFAESLKAGFAMIGDEKKVLCKAFDVLWPLLGKAQRISYVIDGGGVIRNVFHHELAIGRHLDDVRDAVKAIAQKSA